MGIDWPNVLISAQDPQATGAENPLTTVNPSIWILNDLHF